MVLLDTLAYQEFYQVSICLAWVLKVLSITPIINEDKSIFYNL